MRMRWCCVILIAPFLTWGADAVGAERYLEFLNGLRERQFYDFAVLYLDRLATDQSVPQNIRELVPFERAVTLLESVETLPDPELQNKQLDQALQSLDQFVKASPQHPKAAEANSERGRILLGKARVQTWQSQSPSNQASRSQFQTEGRKYVKQARDIYRTARDQYFAAWDKFPRFIDEQTDRKNFEARRDVEIALLRAELDLGLCTYQEAQTYDRGSQDYRKLLTQASTEFEAIHTKYRSQVGGLYARMWQGKCFEEQNDIRKALGIYDELLEHPGTSSVMQMLQNQVLQFRLICLNHDQRKDYTLAVIQAEEWLSKNRGAVSRSGVGLGIRWEQAIAQEKLAEPRDLAAAEKDRLLRVALGNVRFISRYPGQYKDVSMFKIRELMAKLRGPGAAQDPEDFDTAYGLARDLVKRIKEKDDALQAGQKAKKSKEEIAKLKDARRTHLEETARLLTLALRLTQPDTPVKDINQARYLLAYTHYLLRHSYEAAILGEYVAQHYGGEGTPVALDCAYLALAAFVQAYNDSPQRQKESDLHAIVSIGTLLTAKWPKSDRADDTRMQLGQILRERNQPAQAAEWYSQLPESSERYAEAQTAAGQAYWAQYLQSANLPEGTRPPVNELRRWQDAAEKFLRNGIARTEQKIPKDGTTPSELTSAKASLAQILLSKGAYQPCLDLLGKEPHSVLRAIVVADESKRPRSGSVQSTEFASLVYQLQLRAYVGLQKLNEARQTMQTLEKLAAGTAGGEAVTAVYVELGRQLQDELKRLRGLGDDKRLNEVRSSFESFLSDMFKRKEQTFGSLVWVAETYYGLAEGTGGDDARAKGFFEKAGATYEEILRRAKEKPEFANEGTQFAAQLRLVTCRRRQGVYDQALKLAAELVRANANSLETQMEAAYVLQDWGFSGQGDSLKLLRQAMLGGPMGDTGTPCWGWGQMSLNIQRLLETGTPDDWKRYAPSLYQARYNAALCRHKYAMAQTAEDGMKQELEKAKYEVRAFASISDRIDPEWWDKFDQLYQIIQKDLGETPVALEKPKTPISPQPAVAAVAAVPTPQPVAKAKPAAPAKQQEGGFGWGFIVTAIVFFVVGGGLIFLMVKSVVRPRRMAYATAPPPVLPKKTAAAAKAPTKATRPTPAEAPRPKPAKPQPPQTKPDAPGADKPED